MTERVTVGPLGDLAAGTLRLVEWEGLEVLVANCGGTLHAIENRCSHDDGPLNEGELDESACTVECPRHGSVFDLRSGRPLCPLVAHHNRLRAELPRIEELLVTVVRVHGAQHQELHDLLRLFRSLRRELESHIETEERVVFPACRAAEVDAAAVAEDVLAQHPREHEDTGDALVALRELGHDYDAAGALCGTHRRLLEALHQLELGLHQHIHEENNVLFPRARAIT